jgi:hypothetical protein
MKADPARLQQVPARDERRSVEYYRHGMLSPYAALETRIGLLVGKTAAPDRCAGAVNLRADNLSAHRPSERFARHGPPADC